MPVIELNGADAGKSTLGVHDRHPAAFNEAPAVILGGTTIRGLLIDRVWRLRDLMTGKPNLITGDWIGTNTKGAAALGNGLDGIFEQQCGEHHLGKPDLG